MPLFKAVGHGDALLVSLLLSKGADANTTNAHGESALTKAVTNGNMALVSILLARGATPDALHKVVQCSNAAILSLLLASKADPEACGEGGGLPLYCVAVTGDAVAVALYLKMRTVGINWSGVKKSYETSADGYVGLKYCQGEGT
ncbi:ankyrin repeat-containing domain protein [Calycina marina]|uniref:Ankyrin repeat-containing domain protein n=1 Tax=Calycina marina TaxID=1763456 RepID=A0A9P7YW49_9HELO|nr:ankyrin repeat-containing domain protein [Calycina marina]